MKIEKMKIEKQDLTKPKKYSSVTRALLDYYNGKLTKQEFNLLYPKCRFK